MEKHEKLHKELTDFFEHIHNEYGTGCGILALDYGTDGEVVLGMLFGKRKILNEGVIDRLEETCKSVSNGAKLELNVDCANCKTRKDERDCDDEEIKLPDPDNKKEVMKFLVDNDLFDDKGEVSKEKVDKLFEKIAKGKLKEFKKEFGID